jgi:hypothetical protein
MATVAEVNRSPAADALYAALDDVARPGYHAAGVLSHCWRAGANTVQDSGDLAAVLNTGIRSWLDHAARAAADSDPVRSQGVEDGQYMTALNEIDRLMQHRLDAARQHSDDDQGARRRAIPIAEASRHSPRSHEGTTRW